MGELLPQVYSALSMFILFIIVFFIAKLINDFLTPYDIDEQLTSKDNFALSISLAGYFLAILIIYIGSLIGESKGLIEDVLSVGGYSLFGIALLNISRFINDKIILRTFSNVKEIIEDKNCGVGAVQAGSYIATGLIIAGSIHGEGGGPLTALAFFGLGQIFLLIFSLIYNLITPFNLHKELESDNAAAGVAFGGTLIALGILLLTALSGKFVGWKENLISFAIYGLIGFIVLPICRFLFDKILIPKSSLNHEIKDDRNIGAAVLEMVIAISFSCLIFFILKG